MIVHGLALFGYADHMERLSKLGDPLETLEKVIDFEWFRPQLEEALDYSDGSKGGRPPFDPVPMFKAMILQAQHNLSDAKMELMIADRLSWMRFLNFTLGSKTPDENTIRLFRNKITESGALPATMKCFDWQLTKKGYIPMGGQIVDASLIPASKQRNTEAEKQAVKDGKSAAEIWPNDPSKACQKDTDARWTIKVGAKVRYRPDGKPYPQIATPTFGYKPHISIDKAFGFIRGCVTTAANSPDGRQLRHVIADNTSSRVWADSAYRSKSNEARLSKHMMTSEIHRKKPHRKPMPERTSKANHKKSAVRAVVEHVFAYQKNAFGLFIRTIGLARATTKIDAANLAYNFQRLVFHEQKRIAAG